MKAEFRKKAEYKQGGIECSRGLDKGKEINVFS